MPPPEHFAETSLRPRPHADGREDVTEERLYQSSPTAGCVGGHAASLQ